MNISIFVFRDLYIGQSDLETFMGDYSWHLIVNFQRHTFQFLNLKVRVAGF
jgi:hypothetical protein